MYQQLFEFVRREPKTYWFLTTAQAGGLVVGLMLPMLVDKLWLAPFGMALGVLAFTKRNGLYLWEYPLQLVRWLVVQFNDERLDPSTLYRTAASSQEKPVIVIRSSDQGGVVAIRSGDGEE